MLISAARRLSRDSLARNSLLIMATTVSNGGLGYLYWMLAARAVPPDRIGTATAVISAATAVSMIANLGAGHMFIQRLPGSDTATWSRIVGGGLFLAAVATATAATAAAVIVPVLSGNFAFLSGPGGTSGLITAAIAVTLTTLLDSLYVAHRAGHGMLIRNVAVAAGKLVTLSAVLAAGFHGAGAVLLSYVLPTLLISLATIAVAARRLRPVSPVVPICEPVPHPAPSVHEAPPIRAGARRLGIRSRWAGLRCELPHLRAALTGHHLINLTQAGPAALLPVLVTASLGADANAHFYLAWMTASMLFMVSPAVASALYAERTNAAAVPVARAVVVVAAVVGAPAAVLLLAGDRILGLFSAAYAAEGTVLLQILVLAALPDAVVNLAVAHWRSAGEFRRCRRLNLVRAVTCLALAWLMLSGSGVTGAGVAWLAGQTAAALMVPAIVLAARPPTPASTRRPTNAPDTAVGASRFAPASPHRPIGAPDAAVGASRSVAAGVRGPVGALEAGVGAGRVGVGGGGTSAAARAEDEVRQGAMDVPHRVEKRCGAAGETPTGRNA